MQTLSVIAESAGHLWRLAEQGAIVQYGLPTGAAPATADGSDWVHQLLGGAVEAINKIEYIIYSKYGILSHHTVTGDIGHLQLW
jgi:hypothetical protein